VAGIGISSSVEKLRSWTRSLFCNFSIRPLFSLRTSGSFQFIEVFLINAAHRGLSRPVPVSIQCTRS
jgi:hypothetical protein